MSVPRVAVPDAEWRAPDCPGCGRELEHDGGPVILRLYPDEEDEGETDD